MKDNEMMVPIIKVVGDFCNLNCRYCFYNKRDQSTAHVMKDELLEKFIKEYMNLFTGRLSFIWHGGEPLLAGIPFFRRIIELQEKSLKEGQIIRNSIQTNATLIDDKWAEFFKDKGFRIGISLDGNRESHNRFRMNKKGEGSFDRVIRGMEILRKHGIEPGVIQTITHKNLGLLKDNFDFFTEGLKLRGWGINIYLGEEKERISNEELSEFFKDCIDLWLEKNSPNLQIREIENFISGILGKRAPNCTFNGSCAGFFSIEHNGEVYPCDRFSNRPEFLLGNLNKQPLIEILNSPARLRYAERVISLPDECMKCEWLNACHNGCTMHRTGGIEGKYYYCKARKEIFSYLKNKVEEYEEV